MKYAKHRYDTAEIYPTNAVKEKKKKIQREQYGEYLYKKKENERNSFTGQSMYIHIYARNERERTHIDNTI